VVRRYQQIHGDMGPTPKLITKLSFRMNGGTGSFTGTRSIDLEMFIGYARPISQKSFVFAQNFVGAPTTAIARKTINMGPQGVCGPGPNPFTSNMDLVLDALFPYTAISPLIWETVLYSNTVLGTFSALDADQGSNTTGTASPVGAGCTATGRSVPMTHTASYIDCGGILVVNYQVANGPAGAPALLAIGSSNPNLSIPGLCSNLYTNLILLLPLPVLDPSGAVTPDMTANSSFILPNSLAGATIYTQVHALDPARPDPIGISNSDGVAGNVPAMNTAKIVDVARVWNNSGGTTATQGYFGVNTSVGFGLVTEFTY
jgi:hypothetical protein